jgi:hypothetical protein
VLIRKVTTSLALLAALAGPGLATATSAHAADAGPASARAAAIPNNVINHRGNLSLVAVTISGVNATAIGAITEVGFLGHFQFQGPKGFSENSPGGDRRIPAQQGGAIEINPPRLAPRGSLWCVRLWEKLGPGNYQDLEFNCVTAP